LRLLMIAHCQRVCCGRLALGSRPLLQDLLFEPLKTRFDIDWHIQGTPQFFTHELLIFNASDMGTVRAEGTSVCFEVKSIDTKITPYHPWLPEWLQGPRRRRTLALAELLRKVREGLSPAEVGLYQRKLS